MPLLSETFLTETRNSLPMANKSNIILSNLKKFWKFVWEDDSLLSWIVSVFLAFVIIKFVVYPILALLFATTHPVVAVVSGSMEHHYDFDTWWNIHEPKYTEVGITKDQFKEFPFAHGFNTGDIMVLYGKKPEKIEVGDIIVYNSIYKKDPIIHRVIRKWEEDGKLYFATKGDNNNGSNNDELKIPVEKIIGYTKYGNGSTAVIRIPYLGWIKIGFVKLLSLLGVI